jgi:2TM domain
MSANDPKRTARRFLMQINVVEGRSQDFTITDWRSARDPPMPKRARHTRQGALKSGQPPMRSFLIHLIVYVIVVGGLAALNMIINPNHLWFLWVLLFWGIALAAHDIALLIRSFRAER